MTTYRDLRHRLAPLRRWARERQHPVVRRDRLDNERIALIMALTLRVDSCLVDVGAHTGTFLREAVRLAPEGRHLAFEPIPSLAAELARRFPTVDVHTAACAERRGRSSFRFVTNVPAMSGLRERDYGGQVDIEIIQVATEALDDALPPGFAPALIKIDVEGGELGILRGAECTLRKFQPVVIFEHGKGASEFYGTTSADVHATLTKAGLRIFDLDGGGPYSAARLTEEFERNAQWNWVAH